MEDKLMKKPFIKPEPKIDIDVKTGKMPRFYSENDKTVTISNQNGKFIVIVDDDPNDDKIIFFKKDKAVNYAKKVADERNMSVIDKSKD